METQTTTADNLIEELRWRGMLYDMTEGAEEHIVREKVAMYIGYDATGSSLHIGHLIPIISMRRFQLHGHTPIVLLGGGTTMIGDPSGKSEERVMMTREDVEANALLIRAQLERFLDFDGVTNPAIMLDNFEWLGSLNLMEFLRDIGKHFSVNQMLAKDSVKNRIEGDGGISYTEFSYMLMQSYDFLELFRREGCTVQAGGSDQWGNITAGTDLVRRIEGAKAHGIVYPLLTTSSGEKFGKTANISGGMDSVWLDADRTSPYKLYQFWLNTDDADVVKYLKIFTFLSRDEIEALGQAVVDAPGQREAQRTLAQEVTRLVHGDDGLAAAEQASAILFGGEIGDVSAAELQGIFEDVPSTEIAPDRLADGVSLVDLAVELGFETGKKRARTLIQGGGINVNNVKVQDIDAVITLDDAIDGEVIVMRKGRKAYHLVRVG